MKEVRTRLRNGALFQLIPILQEGTVVAGAAAYHVWTLHVEPWRSANERARAQRFYDRLASNGRNTT